MAAADTTTSPVHWVERAAVRATEDAPVDIGTAPAAISGGEAPSEAEFLALRTYVVAIADALTDLGLVYDAT